MDPSFQEEKEEVVLPKLVVKQKGDPLVGTIIANRYELQSLLGRGATTSVYKAFDQKKNRSVAVKLLRTESIFNEQLIRRFKQECETLALLKDNFIVSLYDSGINDSDQPYIVMEFVDGQSLKQIIEEENGLDTTRALKIFIQICAALAAAHEKGVVHRDMKPANIMLTKDAAGNDLVKVLDFGVAKLLVQGETFQTKTQTGEMLGTLLYMSPEQCLEQVLDQRCDVYSVGCVLFETLVGKPPLVGRTAFETMNKHLTEMPEKFSKVRPDKHFDRRLDAILQIAMAKNPADRYQTMAEFQDALTNVLNTVSEPEPEHHHEVLPVESAPPSAVQPIRTVVSTAISETGEVPMEFSAIDVARMICTALIFLLLITCAVSFTHPATLLFVPVLIICLFVSFSYLNDKIKSNPQPSPQLISVRTKADDAIADTSRDGTIYFLAMEAIDGVDWKSIYADRMESENITISDVREQKLRLLAAQEEAWKDVKQYALSKFSELDSDNDGYISKTELIQKREKSNPGLRSFVFLSFLINNIDDIQAMVHGNNATTRGIKRTDLSEYFLLLENANKN